MATLADSLVSSSSRPLALRMRPDLSARQHRYHGRVFWVVKEPIGLNYFRFHEEEYAILCMLDGQASLDDIKSEFEQQYVPQKITYQDLQQFIGMLHRSGLVISNASGQGKQLKRRRDEKVRRELLGKLANVFAFRWRGIDPEWLLNKIYPATGWFFAWPTVLCVLMFGLCALSLVVVQFEEFRTRLPSFHQFFGAANWPYLAVVMGLVKVLHEFGHGLSCKRYGGECHEMGFMLLVFTPALYCNVSDSWMLPNKYHRAFIGAAGMYVELFLASIATFLWWFSRPESMVNQLSLSVMFICSVSTVMFNGNPLLRFDGYYILMDLLEIPNLRQKSTEVAKRFFLETCVGIEQPENPFLPQENRFFFGMFTVAAVIYRWVVVFSIVLFLNQVLEPYGLKRLGQAIGLSGVFGLVGQPLWQLFKFFASPGRMHKVKRHRIVATIAALVATILFVILVPLPFHVSCTLHVVPHNATNVAALVPGRIIAINVRPGQIVPQGEELARLENMDLQITLERLKGRKAELEAQRESVDRRRHTEREIASQLPQLDEMLSAVDKQLAEKTEELGRLTIRAPRAGVIIPPERRSPPPADDGRLPPWSGSPFDPQNQNARLAVSDRLCLIGDPDKHEAELVIDQNDVELVQLGHDVEIMFDSMPDTVLWPLSKIWTPRVFRVKVDAIASTDLKVSPESLGTQSGGDLNTKMDASGRMRPLSTSYQARTTVLEDPDGLLRVGYRGKAKIYTGWQPIGRRLYRYLARTFHFDL